MSLCPSKSGLKEGPGPETGAAEGTRPRTRHSRASQGDTDKAPLPTSTGTGAEMATTSTGIQDKDAVVDSKILEGVDKSSSIQDPILAESSAVEMEPSHRVNTTPPEQPPGSSSTVSTPRTSPTGGEPKVIKKGDQVITSYVDEKTGKITVYEPGIKLEVSDYAGKWYPAKVVEVDGDEQEILVHFEHWSSRFDEWIKMDSNRLRPSPNTNIVKTQFKVGESVEALWNTDGQKYPGVIQNVLPNDYYQVLFDDGIKLKKKSNQIFKLKPVTRNIARSSSSTAPVQTPSSKLMRPLPELTPISRLMSSSVNKSHVSTGLVSSPPPPLIPRPKPKSIRSPSKLSVTPASSISSTVPALTESPPPPLIFAQTETPALPYTNVFTQIDTELGKRKRTVHDYSALLKTPIRPEMSEATTTVVKRKYRRRDLKLDTSLPESYVPQEMADSEEKPVLAPSTSGSGIGLPKLKSKLSPSSAAKNIRTIVVSEKSPLASKAIVRQAQLEDERSKSKVKPKLNEETEELPVEVSAPVPTSISAPVETETTPDVPAKRSRKATEKALALIASIDDYPPVRRIQRRRTLTRKFSLPRSRSGSQQGPSTPSPSKPEEGGSKSPNSEIAADTADEKTCDPAKAATEATDLVPKSPFSAESESVAITDDVGKVNEVSAKSTPVLLGDDDSSKLDSTPSKSEVQSEAASSARPRRSTNRPFSRRAAVAAVRPKVEVKTPPVVDVGPAAPTCAVVAPSPIAPESSEVTPLAKRKRTIHDYSMLLKIRPKFFFDIEEETQRPNRLACTKRSRTRKSTEGDPAQPGPSSAVGSDNLLNKFESESTGEDKRLVKGPDETKAEDPKEAGANATRTFRRASVSLASRKGPLTPEEIQVVSTRTSESNEICGASIILPASATPESVTSRLSVSTRRQSSQSHPDSEKTSIDSKPKVPLLGSFLSSIEPSASDDEELPDIDIDYTPSTVTSKPKADQPAKRPALAVVPKIAPKRPRPNNKWWKKKSPSALALQRSRALANGRVRVKPAPPPPPPPRESGDVLNGLSTGRIKQIRKTLSEIGGEKYVEGQAAFKDVSVDIINCWCGKTDEFGLMIQCEFCLCWQHGQCYSIEAVKDMPTHYICECCQTPPDLRSTMAKEWRYEFHKAGWLPSLNYAEKLKPEMNKMLEETNELMARVYEVREIIHSTRVNLHIMNAKPDHIKLYQWDLPHKTIKEEAQDTRFNKVFRPLLRRLLFVNRNDPKYVEKLRARIQTMIRNGYRTNWNVGTLKKPSVSHQPLPNKNKPSTSTQVVNLDDLDEDIECVDLTGDAENTMGPSIKVEIKEESVDSMARSKDIIAVLKNDDAEISLVVASIMSSILDNLDQIESKPPERPSVIQELAPVAVTPAEDAKPTEIVKDALFDNGSTAANSDPLKELMSSTAELDSSDLLMDFDPSDPKFTTMAEDLVKSCCEEPEGLIKTLEDLAQQNESVANLGTSDSDLMNFLDDAFMDSLDPAFDTKTFEDIKSLSSLTVAPVSQFGTAPGPPTLTRITPELCRENLTLTILDQQKVIDEQLEDIEFKINELAKQRTNGVIDTSSQLKRIENIQRKAKRLIKNLQLMKTVGEIRHDEIHEAFVKRRRAQRRAKLLAQGILPVKKEKTGEDDDETDSDSDSTSEESESESEEDSEEDSTEESSDDTDSEDSDDDSDEDECEYEYDDEEVEYEEEENGEVDGEVDEEVDGEVDGEVDEEVDGEVDEEAEEEVEEEVEEEEETEEEEEEEDEDDEYYDCDEEENEEEDMDEDYYSPDPDPE